jgi:hypothetical protein
MSSQKTHFDRLLRIDRINAIIKSLTSQIQDLRRGGDIAQSECWVARYQVRSKNKIYWYYKLQSPTPLFLSPTGTGCYSKYRHLGKAGSEAHLSAVQAVLRRSLIDEVQQTIDTLTQCLLDIGFENEQQDL